MALANYTDLQTALTEWCDARSDVSSNAADFIRLAEARLNQKLRCREMVTSTDLTPTAGAVTLPSDFVGVVRVVEKSSPRRVLDYISPDGADEMYDSSVTGSPYHFTIIGTSLKTYPQATNDVELTYYQEIPPLVTNTTNWLLTKYPNIYLEASQLEFYRWAKDFENLDVSSRLLVSELEDIQAADDVGVWGNAARSNQGVNP